MFSSRSRVGALVTALVAAAVALATLAGCGGNSTASSSGGSGGSGGSGSTSGTTITLYNGQHPETTHALLAAFEKQTGIHVRERDSDETELAQQIEQEGGSSPADVFYTENSPPLMALEGKGLLSTLPSTILSAVPSQYSSPQGDWVGVTGRVSVMVYNTSQLSESQLPKSIMDLADRQWKGKLAIAPTETDFQPLVTSVAKFKGTQAALTWLKAVRANASNHIEPDNETVTADVNDGQAAIGLINHYYWYRLAKEVGGGKVHSAIGYFAPQDPGYLIDVSGAGVLKSSKHQAAAEGLVAFLVSAAGQQVIGGPTSDSFEYPLRPGVAASAQLRPFSELQPAPLSIADLGDGAVSLQLLQQAQLL
jgi:iron(III) transport system substrate-binding protein